MNLAASPSAPISAHRLARFCKAARLWLMRGAGWLMQAAGADAPLDYQISRAIRPFIRTMTRVVYALLMLKAMARFDTPPAEPRPQQSRVSASAHAPQPVQARALKSKRKISQDPRALIAALLMLLQNLEAHARRLARRLRCGSARRIGRFALSPRAPLLNVVTLLAPACADTS